MNCGEYSTFPLSFLRLWRFSAGRGNAPHYRKNYKYTGMVRASSTDEALRYLGVTWKSLC